MRIFRVQSTIYPIAMLYFLPELRGLVENINESINNADYDDANYNYTTLVNKIRNAVIKY